MAPARYLVAMCDVLGFTSLVATTALERIHERYQNLVEQLEPRLLYRIDPETGKREVVFNCAVFSDTVLCWATAGDTMELLPTLLGQVMATSLDSLPLRAGLAFGECVMDTQKQIYLGQPIIDAYRTEQSQEWMGGAFHPSCWNAPRLLGLLCEGYERSAVRYAVPVKPEHAKRPPLEYALNWPGLSSPDFSVDALIAREHSAPERDKAKWRNARRFYEAVRAGRGSGS